MEINLVVLNVGNSRLAVGSFVAGELGEVTRVPLEGATADMLAEHIGEAWLTIQGRENAAVVAASVNPALNDVVAQAVAQATDGRRIVWVGKDLELPIKVKTEQPEQTGVDRVLVMAAAYEQ